MHVPVLSLFILYPFIFNSFIQCIIWHFVQLSVFVHLSIFV